MSNAAMARENESRVLQAIGLVGWLTAGQVAKWVWGDDNPHSARTSADKLLTRLRERGLILRRHSPLRAYAYVLTKAGAIQANEGVKVPLFRDGYALSQLDVGRQALAVAYLTGQHRSGKTVLGAASLRKALQDGLLTDMDSSGADGIVVDNETGELRAILVVRNTHPELIKKAKRIRKSVGELELLGSAGLLKSFRKDMQKA